MSEFGKVTWRCARTVGKRETCGREATHSIYGIDRCDEHEIDTSPCVWKANMRGTFPFCGIDHQEHGHIFGAECRNTPAHRAEELRKLRSALKKLKAKKFASEAMGLKLDDYQKSWMERGWTES